MKGEKKCEEESIQKLFLTHWLRTELVVERKHSNMFYESDKSLILQYFDASEKKHQLIIHMVFLWYYILQFIS